MSALNVSTTDLYTTDYSSCCVNRKRKTEDTDFSIDKEKILSKKSKTSKHKSNPAKSLLNSQEEEEVVCAPDLLSFIAVDDHTESVNPDVTIQEPTCSRVSPPPLLPKVPTVKNYGFVAPVVMPKPAALVQNPVRNSVVIQTAIADPKPKSSLVHNPASIIKPKGKQIILNTTLKNPITTHSIGNLTNSVEKVSTHKITLKTPNQKLPRLVPGLKYQWFDIASKNSRDIQTSLSNSISELSVDKEKATTMEDLASIHNKFQEVLSKSINSMIQIRRNLRNDFLSSLNQLKFLKNAQETKEDDDDVVFVKSLSPPKSSLAPTENMTVNDRPRGPYLKVRSVSQLHNVPSECITIPDEVIEKISETRKEEYAKKLQERNNPNETVVNSCDISNDSNKENLGSFSAESIDIDKDLKGDNVEESNCTNNKNDSSKQVIAENTESDDIQITPEIQRAIFESKIEKLVNENLKYNVPGVSVKDLKKMLSARVYVSSKYKVKPKKKTKSVSQSSCDDFEILLNRSIVLKK